MIGDQFDTHGEAREALNTAVTSYGARVLGDPRILGNIVTDLLPDASLERSLLVAAAEAGVATKLTQHVEQEHLPVDTAISMVARALSESRAIDPAASSWVATEYAQALGYQVRAASVPPPAHLDAISTPKSETNTVRRPRYSPSAEPFPRPQSPQAPLLQSPPPQIPLQQSPPAQPLQIPLQQSPPAPPLQSPPPQLPLQQSPPAPLFPAPAPPTVAAEPPLGPTAPPAPAMPPGYPGGAIPSGPTLPPPGFAPAGYPPPAWAGPTKAGKSGLKTALIIAAVSVSGLLVAGGVTGAVVALQSSPKPPVHHPPVAVLSGATRVATLTAPDGGTFSLAAFNPDGTIILADGGAANQDEAYFFSATTHKYISTVRVPKGHQIYPLALTPDDKGVIAADCGTSCYIYEYNIATGHHSAGFIVPASQFGVSDDGNVEVNETNNAHFIDTYDPRTAVRTGHFPNPTTKPIVDQSLRVSADGQEVLVSAVDGTTYVLSTRTGQTLARFHYQYAPNPKDSAAPQGLLPELSPDGKTVGIPGSKTTPAQIWNVATGTNVTPKDSHWPKTDPGVGIGFSSDGAVIVTAFPNSPIDLWNIYIGSHISRITIPGASNWAIQDLGPSGSELLFASHRDKNHDSKQLYLYSVP